MGTYFSQLVHEAILSDGDASLKLHGVKLSKKDAQTYSAKLVEQLGSKLQYLSVDSAKLKLIPPELCSGLTVLEHLQLSGNQISELPSSIGVMKSLKTLILSQNLIAKFPSSLLNLHQLRSLNLSFNSLHGLPEQFGESLSRLSFLSLKSNKLEDSTTWPCLSKCVNLTSLDLSSNCFKSIPSSISAMTNLKELNVSANDISSIEHLFKMNRLKSLEISRLAIEPSSFSLQQPNNNASALRVLASLTRLEFLDLSHNKIAVLSPDITNNLTKLRVLKLHNNRLLRLPKEISNLENLSTLTLQENQLIKIGKRLGQCSNLEILKLEFNNLTSLPLELKALSKLHCLMLHFNRFKIIPDPLYDMEFVSHLYTLSLEGNPLTDEITKSIMEKGTREYIMERDSKADSDPSKRKGRPSLSRAASQYGSLRAGSGAPPVAAAPVGRSLAPGNNSGFASLRRGVSSQRALIPVIPEVPDTPPSPTTSLTTSGGSNSIVSGSVFLPPSGGSTSSTTGASSTSSPNNPSTTSQSSNPSSTGTAAPGVASTTSSGNPPLPIPAVAVLSSPKSRLNRSGSASTLLASPKPFQRSKTSSSPTAPIGLPVDSGNISSALSGSSPPSVSPSSSSNTLNIQNATAMGSGGTVVLQSSSSGSSINKNLSKSFSRDRSSSNPSRVSGNTTSLSQVVKLDPTLEVPPFNRFKESFESLMKHEDLSDARCEEFRKVSNDSKWAMMKIYKGTLVQLLSNNTARLEREKKFEAWQKLDKKVERLASPHYFISSLKGQNISMSDMTTLKTMFESAPLQWIYDFIEDGGISELARYLMHSISSGNGKEKSAQDLVRETEAIGCMSVLASASSSMVLSTEDAIASVVLCLASDQLAIIKPALKLLLEIHKEHSYASKVILEALESTKRIRDFPSRFTLLINLLSDLPYLKQDYDVKSETLSLISKITEAHPLIDRYLLRKEMTKVGLITCLEQLNEAPHHALQQQLEIIDDAMFADSEAIQTLAATDYRVLLKIREDDGGDQGDNLSSSTANTVSSNGSPFLSSSGAFKIGQDSAYFDSNTSSLANPNALNLSKVNNLGHSMSINIQNVKLFPLTPAMGSAHLTPNSAHSSGVSASSMGPTANAGNLKILVADMGSSSTRFTPTTTVGDAIKRLLNRYTIDHPEFYSLFFLSTASAKMEGFWADDPSTLIADIVSKFGNAECIASFKMRPWKLNVDVPFNKTTVWAELEPMWSVQQAIAHIVATNGFSMDGDYELSVVIEAQSTISPASSSLALSSSSESVNSLKLSSSDLNLLQQNSSKLNSSAETAVRSTTPRIESIESQILKSSSNGSITASTATTSSTSVTGESNNSVIYPDSITVAPQVATESQSNSVILSIPVPHQSSESNEVNEQTSPQKQEPSSTNEKVQITESGSLDESGSTPRHTVESVDTQSRTTSQLSHRSNSLADSEDDEFVTPRNPLTARGSSSSTPRQSNITISSKSDQHQTDKPSQEASTSSTSTASTNSTVTPNTPAITANEPNANTSDIPMVEIPTVVPLEAVELPHIPLPNLHVPLKKSISSSSSSNLVIGATRGKKSSKPVVLGYNETLHEMKYSQFTISDLLEGKVRLQLALKPEKVRIVMAEDGILMEVDVRWTVTDLLERIAEKVPELQYTIGDYGIILEAKSKVGKHRSQLSGKATKRSSRKPGHSIGSSGGGDHGYTSSTSTSKDTKTNSSEWLHPSKTLAFYDFDPRKHTLRLALKPREVFVILPLPNNEGAKEISLMVGFEETVFTVIKQVLTHLEGDSVSSGSNYSLFSGETILIRRKTLRDAGVKPGDHLVLRQESETQTAVTSEEDMDIWSEPNSEAYIKYDDAGVSANSAAVTSNLIKKSQLLSSATLNKLVESLTNPDNYDPEFHEIFLFTYRSFVTPEHLLIKLMQRYAVPDSFDLRERNTIRVRVCVFLTQWLDKCYADVDDLVVEKINIWVETDVEEDRRASLFSALNKVRTRKALVSSEDQHLQIIEIPDLDHRLSLADLDAFDIAKQITVYTWDVFSKIKPVEFFDCAWSKPKYQHLAPNVMEMISRFNFISNWVASEICSEQRLRARRTKFAKLVKAAVHLREMNNFHMMYAFVSAWNNVAVSRLKWTLEKLSKQTRQSMVELENLMSMEGSFKVYREIVKRSGNSSMIPYIGILLKDLTFIEDGNPNIVNGLINWYKRRLLHNVVGDYLRSVLVPYRLSPAVVNGTKCIDLIQNCLQLEENDLYNASLKAEPRGAKLEQLD